MSAEGQNGAGLHAVPDPAGAAPQPGQKVDMLGPIQLTLVSGRPAILFVPKDLTLIEGYSLINGVMEVASQIHAARPKPSRIVRASCLPKTLRR